MSLLRDCALVALGGAFGSVARYLAVLALKPISTNFPWATLTVNVLGSFLIGLTAAHLLTKPNQTLTLLLVFGVFGGFTTFSTFSIENLDLLKNGQTTLALTNIALSCTLGLTAAALGFTLVNRP